MPKLKKIFEYGFYLLIFLLPWQTRWIWHSDELAGGSWEYGSFSLYGTDILLGVLLVLGGVFYFKNFKVYVLKFRPSWWLLFFFEFWVFLSILWAEDWFLSIYGWIRILLGIGLFWLVNAVLSFNFKKLWLAFVGAGLLQSLLAITQFLTQKTFSSKWLGMARHEAEELGQFVIEIDSGRWLRAYGSLPHPNVLGGFLVLGIIFGLMFWLNCQDRRARAGLLAGICLMSTSLFFTFSRSAWLALGLFFLIYLVKIFPQPAMRNQFLKLVAVVFLLIILMGILYQPLVLTRFQGQSALEIKSHQERLSLNQEAWQLIRKNPVQGVGINNYTLAVYKQLNSEQQVWRYQPVHNIYLLIWAELGLVGFLLWLGLVIWSLKQSQQTLIGLILVVILTISLFDHYFWTLASAQLLLWLVLGLGFKLRTII